MLYILPFDKRVGVLRGFVGGEAVRGDNLKPLTELLE